MSEPLSISAEDVDAMFDLGLPPARALRGYQTLPVTDHGPLEAYHLEAAEAHVESGESVNLIGAQRLHNLRASHHRMAQLIASGKFNNIQVAALCNRDAAYISRLKSDPAFAELVTHYQGVVDDAFADFTSAASDLSMDMLQHLAAMLDESPEKFGPGHTMDAIKLLADRTGHAPISKAVNVNINTGLGDRLRLARERASAAYIIDVSPGDGSG